MLDDTIIGDCNMEWLALGLLGLFGSLMGAGLSYSATTEANQINRQISEEQNKLAQDTLAYNKEQDAAILEYNKWLNQTQMEREDTAVQRRMADLQAAGLSPLLAAGDAATSGAGGLLSRSQTSSPDLQGYDFANPFSGFAGLGQDVYNSAVKGYAEYNQAQKNQAETSLLKSQTEAKNIENSWLQNKLYDESEQRYLKLQQARADIALAASKLQGQDKDNYLKDMQGYKEYIEQEIKRVEYTILKHDADIVTSSIYPSDVILSGLDGELAQSMFDLEKLNTWQKNYNGGAGSSESIPLPNQTKSISQTEMLEDGSIVYGNYYGTGYISDDKYYAGNGYKIKPDNTMWYGSYQVKPEYVTYAKTLLSQSKTYLPKNIMLYSYTTNNYKDGRHDDKNRESTYESYNYSDYNLMH